MNWKAFTKKMGALDRKCTPRFPKWLVVSVAAVIATAIVWTPLALATVFVFQDWGYFWTWWTRMWMALWFFIFLLVMWA